MSNYNITAKDFSGAKYISAGYEALLKFNRQKEPNFPSAKYIWPFCCVRFHAYRLFTPRKKVVKAEAAFLCDNLFDLWINGKAAATDTKHMEMSDITKLICSGENNLHIRGYQSATDRTFSSALTGGIRLYYEDGETEDIVTDGEFKQVELISFWENREPDGFETATKGKSVKEMNVMQLHPIALKRSFYFVKDFIVKKPVASAYLYSSALGCYEPYMNGKRITDSFFMPFGTNYRKEYQKFDIKPFVKRGSNSIGAILGNGSYNCSSTGNIAAQIPQFIAIIAIKYTDGNEETIITDESWRCIPTPLVDNDIQYGERYDARLETENWCTKKSKNDRAEMVKVLRSDKNQVLIYQNYPLIKKTTEYEPSFCKFIGENTPMFDVGQCISGRARISFQNLEKGQKIRIRYCERLTSDGFPENGAYVTVFYPEDCAENGRSANFMRNMDVYFAKGAKTEVYECRFAYTGFRYIWIEGLVSPYQLRDITAFELRNDVKITGDIKTADNSIMRIFNATKRAWLNNISNGPTDCPTREKNYWNGDSQIFSHTACWLTDNSRLLSRWTDNGIKMHEGPYAWEDETYEIPYTLYRFYGDKGILKKRFPEMLRLIDKRCEFDNMILPEKGISHQYNDWLSPKGISPDTEFFGGCWYYHMLDRVSEIAAIIGQKEKAAELRKKADAARYEFNKRHLIENGCDYDAKNQCGLILPLAFGIAPNDNRQALADKLAEYIKKENYHITTGFIGTRYMADILSDFGYADVAYKVISNKTAPSWISMLDTGATAITESWYGCSDPDKSMSMSHFSLGAVSEWFFEYLGGIRINDSEPGLSKVVLKPVMIKEIGSFSVSYQTQFGEIRTSWKFTDGKPVFKYSVPEGVSVEAVIY